MKLMFQRGRKAILLFLTGLLLMSTGTLALAAPPQPPSRKTSPQTRKTQPTPPRKAPATNDNKQSGQNNSNKPAARRQNPGKPGKPGIWNNLSKAMGRLMPTSVRKSWTKTQKKWNQTMVVYTAIKKLLSEEDKERRARLKKEKKAARKARWKRQDNSIESQVRAEFRMTFFQRACLRGSSRACLEWMKMEPQKVDPQHFLRGILLRRKQWKQVLPLCKMLAKRKKPHFEDQLCLAETLAALGKHLKAQQQYTTLLKQYPNHGPTWLALGELEWKRDLFPQAERACRKATVLLPSSSEAWECLARSLLSQKNRKKETLKAYHKSCTLGSSTACQKVLKLRPKGVRGWWWWGTTVARMGSRGISLETVRRSCQLGVASACINLSREMLKKAKSLLKHNQPARANGWYQRATTVAPTFAPAWREKGLFLVSQKQWPSACSSLATSLRLNPRQPKLWTTLSICYKKRANLTLLRSQKALKQACALGINTACQQLKK